MQALDHTATYLEGPFAPVPDEASLDGLEVEGRLPPELDGMFVKNSPNARFAPEGRYHWFDGDGMVHGVRLRDGRASYVNRWVRTRAFAHEEAAGRALWRGIMEPVDLANPLGPAKDTANTDVTWHAGKLLATWWLSGEPYELAVPSLETVGPCRMGGERAPRFASHPKVCPVTGELVVFDYSTMKAPYLRYGVAAADGTLGRLTPIELPGARLLHDLAITTNYTIFFDFPMMWRSDKLQAGKRRVVFDREAPARFGVLPRHGAGEQPRWFEASPCYAYHTVNAWEEEREGRRTITIVAARIEDPLPADRAPDPRVPRLDFIQLVPFLHRWRLDLDSGAVTEERLDDRPTEFPRVNPAKIGRPSRFAWNVTLAPTSRLLFEGLVKYDLLTGRSTTRSWGPGRWGTEAVFAARPGATAEDDGWVLVQLTLEGEERAELVVLDAADLEAPPVATVKIPRRVPIGFHTTWVPGRG
jgi:carotenoid cleavage dioxygenase-like enzyme